MYREDMVVGNDSPPSSSSNSNSSAHGSNNTSTHESEEEDNNNREEQENLPLLIDSTINNNNNISNMGANNNTNNNNNGGTKFNFKQEWRLYISVLLSVISTFQFGYNTSVISSAILELQTLLHLKTLEKSALVSIILLGCMLGSMMSGLLVDRIGRKNTLLLNNLFYLVGPVLSAIGTNYTLLMFGRVISGIGVGVASTLVPFYISELAPPRTRGALGLLRQSTITFGIMVAALIAWRIIHYANGWRYLFIIAAGPSFIQLSLAYWLYETPTWLVSKSRTGEAYKVLSYLDNSSTPTTINNQLQKINNNIIEQRGNQSWRSLFNIKYLRVYFIGFGISMFQQFVGINCVIYYSAIILESAGFAKERAVLISGLVGIPQLIMMIGSIWLIDRFGRRPLLIISNIGMIAGLALLGYAFIGVPVATKSGAPPPHIESTAKSWIAVGGMVFFKLAFSVGMGPIPLILASEIYPSKIRGKAMSVCSLLNWLANFIANISFLPIQELLGQSSSYWIFSGVCLLCLVFVIVWVPETKGVSIDTISKMLVPQDYNNNNSINNSNQQPDNNNTNNQTTKTLTLNGSMD